MSTIKNALEEIVVLEVQEQLTHLNQPSRAAINISEVAAFALNRLPTLYVSTSRGWLQQRKRAHNELRHQIVSAVQQALLGIRECLKSFRVG
jgi:myo-inositol catabolism protein IolC